MQWKWITTSNISQEAWRLILEYANTDSAIEAIENRHGLASKRQKEDYKKQAQQIRVSILQAREYFSAAEAATLFTSPNLLYYGMVSLASAIMLLLGTGEKSLDYLRRKPENNNHGLNFTTGVNGKSCFIGVNILEKSCVEIRKNGHFMNWYATLPTEEPIPVIVKHLYGTSDVRRREGGGFQSMSPACQLAGQKRSVIDLLSRMPDLFDDFSRYGLQVVATRVSYEIVINEGPPRTVQHCWRLHGAPTKDHLDRILEGFKVVAPSSGSQLEFIHVPGNIPSCGVMFTESESHDLFSYPSIRESLQNNQIMYEDDLKTREIADAYLAAYGLSMLSRYYPDLWISCLESHCKAAKLIERFISVLIEKVPMMVLSVMAPSPITISTHQPPWYS